MRNFIDIVESLQEAPIDDFQVIGDLNQPGSLDDRKDVHITRNHLKSQKAIQKILDIWKKVPYTFNFYIIHKTKDMTGVSKNPVTKNTMITDKATALSIYPILTDVLKSNDDSISIVYTTNVTNRIIPFTAWILAHRIVHIFQISGDFKNKNSIFSELDKIIFNFIGDIAKDVFKQQKHNYSILDNPTNQNVYSELLHNIFTMRSARENYLNNSLDVPGELLAQYLITGKITFNKIPTSITFDDKYGGSFYTKIHKNTVNADPEQLEIYNAKLDIVAHKLEELFDKLLNSVKGKVLMF